MNRPAPIPDAPADGLVVDSASVTYRNGMTALEEASLRMPRGSITALVGVNGAG
ncbi:MAG: manganese/iron ABC transporter ATP-binding protein, partial [Rhodobacteraceae bacterium]|nr:manganese/iron ABC transporter ATP-binding protein [Paracoccaceae bacterium]